MDQLSVALSADVFAQEQVGAPLAEVALLGPRAMFRSSASSSSSFWGQSPAARCEVSSRGPLTSVQNPPQLAAAGDHVAYSVRLKVI